MKKIIIGIDISKEKLDATAIDVRSGQLQIIKLGYQAFENRPMGFRKMLVWSRHLLAEAGLEMSFSAARPREASTGDCATTSTPKGWTSGGRAPSRSSRAAAYTGERMTRRTP